MAKKAKKLELLRQENDQEEVALLESSNQQMSDLSNKQAKYEKERDEQANLKRLFLILTIVCAAVTIIIVIVSCVCKGRKNEHKSTKNSMQTPDAS